MARQLGEAAILSAMDLHEMKQAMFNDVPMRHSKEPTRKQLEILRFIARHIGSHGFPPSLRDIGTAFGLSSLNGISEHLVALTRKGLINREFGGSRTMTVTEKAREILTREALDVQQSTFRFITPIICALCGATRFEPNLPCVMCRVMLDEKSKS